MSRILITGGSGFIGINLMEYCISLKTNVINIDIVPPKNPEHIENWQHIDILDKANLKRVVQNFQPEYIFHMAARTDLNGNCENDYAVNIRGVKNVIEVIEHLTCLKRIIFASSRLVCQIGYQPKNEFDYRPTTVYGKSKVKGERIVRENADKIPCSWVIVRPTSLWGPWFDIPYKNFFTAIDRGVYFHPKGKIINKSFGFVGNTVFQLNKLIEVDNTLVQGKTLYLADYPPLEISSWSHLIQKELGAKKIRSLPQGILRFLSNLGDILKYLGFPNPPLTNFRLNNLLTEMVYDLTPLQTICGDLPYNIQQGVAITVEWLRNHD